MNMAKIIGKFPGRKRSKSLIANAILEHLEKGGASKATAIIPEVNDILRPVIANGDPNAVLEHLRQPLLNYIRHVRSGYKREIMQKAAQRADGYGGEPEFTKSDGSRATLHYPGILDAHVLALPINFNSRVFIFGEMSPNDHEWVALQMRKKIDEMNANVDRHEGAAKTIREAGVNCLNELV